MNKEQIYERLVELSNESKSEDYFSPGRVIETQNPNKIRSARTFLDELVGSGKVTRVSVIGGGKNRYAGYRPITPQSPK